MNRIKGLTFIEVILVLAIVLTIGTMAASFSGNFFFSKNVSNFYEMFRSDIRQAQLYSMEGRGGSEWGVALRGRSLILFRGSSYASRESAFDESVSIPGIVAFSGFDEVVMERGTGRLSGTMTDLRMEGSGEVRSFSLSKEGALKDD